jgi:hypothetical protein
LTGPQDGITFSSMLMVVPHSINGSLNNFGFCVGAVLLS